MKARRRTQLMSLCLIAWFLLAIPVMFLLAPLARSSDIGLYAAALLSVAYLFSPALLDDLLG